MIMNNPTVTKPKKKEEEYRTSYKPTTSKTRPIIVEDFTFSPPSFNLESALNIS